MKNLSGILGSKINSFMNNRSCHFSMRLLVWGGIIFVCMTQSLFASGIVKGKVFDKNTKDALPGANIIIKGTSIGAAADIQGVYTIPNAPSGEQTIVVSCIGYSTISVEVTVPEEGSLQQDFKLESVVLKGDKVTITAQALGQNKAINTQLTARTIKNVVSAERIQELPDESAAAALSRLPGVSLQDGDKVVIRGLQAKMNAVLINGVALPSTDMNDRSTNLGFISSNMLAGIEVTKVITPDMDANTIGGVVDLKIREAQTGFHVDLLSQGMYNTQDHTSDNYKFWGSMSQRFINDKLGVFVQGNAERINGGLDQTSAGYGISDNEIDFGYAPYFMNTFTFTDEENVVSNYGGSLILDYKLPSGKIVLQNTLAHTINDNARHRTVYSFTSPIQPRFSINRDKHNKELMINALQMDYDFGFIKMQLGLAHSFSDKNTDIRYGDAGTNLDFTNTTNPVQFLSATGDTLTADDFQDDDRLKLKTEDVYGMIIPEENWRDAAMAGWAVTRSEAFKQHLYNANLDFMVPLAFSRSFSGNIKFGGKLTRSTRENDANETYHRVGDNDFYAAVPDFIPGKTLNASGKVENKLTLGDIRNNDYNRGGYYLNGDWDYKYAFNIDMMDRFMVEAQDGWDHVPAHAANSARNDFEGTETFSAGYLMGDFNFGSRLSLLGGLRYEHYNMDYKANFVYVTHDVDGDCAIPDTLNTVNRNDDDFFPNAQLRFKFTDWADLRMAYSKSIIRPDYLAIIPSTLFAGSSHSVGNSRLKPTISDNLDLSFSVYNNKIGLITLGGFYKEMQDIFFASNIYYKNIGLYDISFPDSAAWRALGFKKLPAPSDKINSYLNNPNPAYVKGLEVEWQTNFWYLPNPFDKLVFNINYARIWSEMDYQQIINKQETYTYTDPKTGRPRTGTRYVTTDTIRTAQLLNQGDHVVNIALGTDYKGFSGRLSFNFQSGVVSYIGGRPEADQYIGNVYKWDLTLQQKLPVRGMTLAFNGINIFHNVNKAYQKFPNELGGSINENLIRTTYAPRKFEFSLRYSL